MTWTRDSSAIGSGVTVLRDDFRGYTHSINATEEGFYTCTVSNDTPDNASVSFNATSEYSNDCVETCLYDSHLILSSSP